METPNADYLELVDEGTIGGAEPTPAQSAEPTPGASTPPEPTPEEKERQRFEYWQSVADKERKEKEQLQFAAPVARLLEARPDLREKLVKEIETGLVPPVQAPQGPQKPVPPARPENFDEVAAYSEPSSESFKFRKAYEAYREKMVEYLEQRDISREQALKADAERRFQERQHQEQMSTLKVVLQQKGLSPPEVESFIDTFTTPDKVSLDHMVELYRIVSGKPKADPAAVRAAELAARRERSAAPTPPGFGAAGAEPPLGEQDEFTASFREAAKRARGA